MQGREGTVVVLASSLLAALAAAIFLYRKRKLGEWIGVMRCQSEESPGVVTENVQGCKENKWGIQADEMCVGVLGAIGKTPLIRISSLSDATGCEVGRSPSSPFDVCIIFLLSFECCILGNVFLRPEMCSLELWADIWKSRISQPWRKREG